MSVYLDIHRSAIMNCIGVLLDHHCWRATKYLSPKEVVKVTRKKFSYRKSGYTFGRDLSYQITIGRPNFNERRFVKACIKSNVPFPVNKIQLKALPVRRKPQSTRKVRK